MSNKKIYFTAGPAKVVDEVMEQAQREFLDYNGTGIGVCELSHRSKTFENILDTAEADLRKLMNIPDNYYVLFMHGGAKTQFDSVPTNLCQDDSTTDYLVTGTWSKMAAKDAEKHCKVSTQVFGGDKFNKAPAKDQLTDSTNATYRYYCDNETVQGVEFPFVPESGDVPLVSDMTSNFLSRPVDVSKFGLIFASAQKNCGIAGLTVVIVRKDLIGKQKSTCPTIQNYKVMADNKSLYNTPPTFAIYIAGLCFKWMLNRGGLEAMDKISREKSSVLYDLIDNSGGFYICPVSKESRSRMNVVFLLANKELESKFLAEAAAANLYDIKGHRSVGGFRASIYHGISMDDVNRLAKFMKEFSQKNLP